MWKEEKNCSITNENLKAINTNVIEVLWNALSVVFLILELVHMLSTKTVPSSYTNESYFAFSPSGKTSVTSKVKFSLKLCDNSIN